MPWSDYPLTSIVVPGDASDSDPRIVLGLELAQVPADVITYYAGLGYTVISAIAFYDGVGRLWYYIDLEGDLSGSAHAIGLYAPAGVATVREVMFFNFDTVHDDLGIYLGGLAPVATRTFIVSEDNAERWIDGPLRVYGSYVNPIRKYDRGTGNGTTVVNTFANIPTTPAGLTVTYVKRFGAGVTNLEIDMRGGAYSDVATGVEWGVQYDGAGAPVDVAQGAYTFNAPAVRHETFSSLDVITGLAADTYVITGRWRNPGAVGTITTDAADTWYLRVQEVPA